MDKRLISKEASSLLAGKHIVFVEHSTLLSSDIVAAYTKQQLLIGCKVEKSVSAQTGVVIFPSQREADGRVCLASDLVYLGQNQVDSGVVLTNLPALKYADMISSCFLLDGCSVVSSSDMVYLLSGKGRQSVGEDKMQTVESSSLQICNDDDGNNGDSRRKRRRMLDPVSWSPDTHMEGDVLRDWVQCCVTGPLCTPRHIDKKADDAASFSPQKTMYLACQQVLSHASYQTGAQRVLSGATKAAEQVGGVDIIDLSGGGGGGGGKSATTAELDYMHAQMKSGAAHNTEITSALKELGEIYSILPCAERKDEFRSTGFSRAAAIVKRWRVPLTASNYVEQQRPVYGIGESVQTVIKDLVTLRYSTRLEELRKDGTLGSMRDLQRVHSIGSKTAQSWIDKGVRSVFDLKKSLGLHVFSDTLSNMGDVDTKIIDGKLQVNRKLIDAAKLLDRVIKYTAYNGVSAVSLDQYALHLAVQAEQHPQYRTDKVFQVISTLNNINSNLQTGKPIPLPKEHRAMHTSLLMTGPHKSRIPREEVTAIASYVSLCAKQLFPSASVVCCGSFRRGRDSCGDVDILQCDGDWEESEGKAEIRKSKLKALLKALQSHCVDPVDWVTRLGQTELAISGDNYAQYRAWRGIEESNSSNAYMDIPPLNTHIGLPFLLGSVLGDMVLPRSNSLVFIDDSKNADRATWMGYCMVPPTQRSFSGIPRRLDIKLFPRSQFPYALLYFTGSDYFNRSMRYHAHQTGLSLSEKALERVVRENRVKTAVLERISCPEETDVFAQLGLKFVEPWNREIFE